VGASYADYSYYYASRCLTCAGKKYAEVNGIKTACACQNLATTKYRLEQFEVYPSDLKYKSWDDFRGVDESGENKLTDVSFISAKQKALKYCFSSSSVKDRKSNLIVHSHLKDGQNVIISGDGGSGKTLIAMLIIKEVAYACQMFNLDISFKYIKTCEIQSAASWDNKKQKDHGFLEDVQEYDFLVIDSVEMPMGHTSPPDSHAMDNVFRYRKFYSKPTIIVCSKEFYRNTQKEVYRHRVMNYWGSEFLSLFMDTRNLHIELNKCSK
jgi:DNA replication protein DnaC